MRTLLLIGSLVGLLVLSLAGAAAMWLSAGDTPLSMHGIIALILGVVLALALGMGLMFLVFYSSRHGHDDQAGR